MIKTTWPELSYPEAKATYETLHMWTQIVGKIKLTKLPWVNHSWHVTLLVTPKGFTTAAIPDGNQHVQIDFDFIGHQLHIETSLGKTRSFGLEGLSVADFYETIKSNLSDLGIRMHINPVPSEIEHGIPFHKDTVHATYEPKHATALHRAFLCAQNVFTQFRSEFKGKCSPVHLFWGSFDLAVSRFSGREAPKHPGGVPSLPDRVAQEAYSHEVSSCGFWPGNETLPFAAFYSYVYPEPEGFKDAPVRPEGAYYHPDLREFILPYETVRQAADPSSALLDFLHDTFNAAAKTGRWDHKLFGK